MIFDQMIKAVRGDGLLDQSLDEIDEMFRLCERIFCCALECLTCESCRKECEIDPIESEIDKRTEDTRRMIVEYLAINSAPNISAALTLGQVLTDLERIGDISGNIRELEMTSEKGQLGEEFLKDIRDLNSGICEMFSLTQKAFRECDSDLAADVSEKNNVIRKKCDSIFSKAWTSGGSDNRVTIVHVLSSKYIKRVSEHLKNICTSIIKPYPEIGHSK